MISGELIRLKNLVDDCGRTARAIQRGKEVYRRAECFKCHGEDARGLAREQGNFDWADEAGRHIPRALNLRSGLFKGGTSAKDIYLRFVTGMNVGPMPSFENSLPSEEDRWALAHYVRSLFALELEQPVRASKDQAPTPGSPPNAGGFSTGRQP